MTHKEEAKELFERFKRQIDEVSKLPRHLKREAIKQCALICADEKIVFLGELFLKNFIKEKNYRVEMGKLFEVKQEIIKL